MWIKPHMMHPPSWMLHFLWWEHWVLDNFKHCTLHLSIWWMKKGFPLQLSLSYLVCFLSHIFQVANDTVPNAVPNNTPIIPSIDVSQLSHNIPALWMLFWGQYPQMHGLYINLQQSNSLWPQRSEGMFSFLQNMLLPYYLPKSFVWQASDLINKSLKIGKSVVTNFCH